MAERDFLYVNMIPVDFLLLPIQTCMQAPIMTSWGLSTSDDLGALSPKNSTIN